ELYSGQRQIPLDIERIEEFEKSRFLKIEQGEISGIYPNEYVILVDKNNPFKKTLGRYHGKKGGIVPLIKPKEGVWGIHPKNIEQQFAFDALLNNEINLVSLVGKAGTGKTLLAIAAGLECAITKQTYSRVLVSRPIVRMGRDLGFLPGDINEKLGPWMQPIFDNIDYLFGNQRAKNEMTTWDELINQGLLHVEPLTYIRGRSLPGQYMIVDESQNLTPHEIKTIITRAGDGTKIVLTGDSEQIDNPYLDSINNGLVYCIDKLKGEAIVAHTKLQQGERSPLSAIASELLYMNVTRDYQRKFLRAPYRRQVLFGDREFVFKAHTLNISEGGLLLDQIPYFPESDSINLVLSLPQYPYFKNFDMYKLKTYCDDLLK